MEVYSVYRLVRSAFLAGVPIAILNQGETRLDREAAKLVTQGIVTAEGSSGSDRASDRRDRVSSGVEGGGGGRAHAPAGTTSSAARDIHNIDVEEEVHKIIQFKSKNDCGHLLSALSAYYQNI